MGIDWEEAATAMRRLAWYVRHADLPYTIADVRPVTDAIVDRHPGPDHAQRSGRGPTEGPATDRPRRRIRLMDHRPRRMTPGRLGGAPRHACSSSRPRAAAAPAPAPSTGGGTSAAPGAQHGRGRQRAGRDEARLDPQQGHDRRRDQGRDPEGGRGSSSATGRTPRQRGLVDQFQKYVKATYGVDIKLTYDGSQAPSEYLTKLAAASKGGNPAPYDVMAVEENYWADADRPRASSDNFLPSDLIPNQKLVLDQFQHVPTSIAFQSTAFPGVVYNKAKAPFLKSLKDLAEPARSRASSPCRRPVTSRPAGSSSASPSELGKDYKDPNQMKEVVDWAMTNIGPNVTQVHQRPADDPAAARDGRDRRVRVLERHGAARVPQRQQGRRAARAGDDLPGQRLPLDPEERPAPRARPDLHQLAARPDVQFPNAWPINHGQWSELSEGFLGPDYVSLVPDWFKADYDTYYPTLDQIKTNFKTIDWTAYNASAKVWQDYYASKIGQ